MILRVRRPSGSKRLASWLFHVADLGGICRCCFPPPASDPVGVDLLPDADEHVLLRDELVAAASVGQAIRLPSFGDEGGWAGESPAPRSSPAITPQKMAAAALNGSRW